MNNFEKLQKKKTMVFSDTSNLNLSKKIKISKFDTSFIIKNDKNIHIGDRLLIRKAEGATKDTGRKSFLNDSAYYYSYSKIKENE